MNPLSSARRESDTPLRDWILPVGTAIVCAIALLIGWRVFGHRTLSRTYAAAARSDEVAHIWGGPLLQPQPQVSWRRADASTPELNAVEIAATKVEVVLDVEYRRRGVTEYPGYRAEMSGGWEFRNPIDAPVHAAFSIGLPSERSALMLTDLQLLVDGREDAKATEYAPDRIVWVGTVAPRGSARFTVHYRARGIERFGYSLAPKGAKAGVARPITKFELSMVVRGVSGELDFPIGAMTPSLSEPTSDGGTRLVWSVERMLTSFDIGIVLPDKSGVTHALGRLIDNAPWFYVMYAAAVLCLMARRASRVRALHLIGFSAAYFLYFPLTTYLVAYMPWAPATTIGLAAVTVLAVGHAARFLDSRSALGITACQLLFLAVPAAAYLIPTHTGLILVTAGFVAVALGMSQLGSVARRCADDEETPALPRKW